MYFDLCSEIASKAISYTYQSWQTQPEALHQLLLPAKVGIISTDEDKGWTKQEICYMKCGSQKYKDYM